MRPTDTSNPEYYHKVVDCQYACPAHTPVPEYIRLIAAQKYDDAYMINWYSNVFPGVLGWQFPLGNTDPVCRQSNRLTTDGIYCTEGFRGAMLLLPAPDGATGLSGPAWDILRVRLRRTR